MRRNDIECLWSLLIVGYEENWVKLIKETDGRKWVDFLEGRKSVYLNGKYD